MQQRKCGRRQQASLFAASGRRFYQRRRIPFGEVDTVAADFKPTLQKVELGAFPGPVDAFDDDQGAGISAFGSRLFSRGGIGDSSNIGSAGGHMNNLHRIIYHISEQ